MSKFYASNDKLIWELIKETDYRFYKNGQIKKYFKKTGDIKTKLQPVYVSLTSAGYQVITYKGTKLAVSRIIFLFFNQTLNPKMVINHINTNKLDNRLSNLEMITLQQNSYHNYKIGKNKSTKLSFKQVNSIREEFSKGISKQQLSKKYNVSLLILSRTLSKKTWSENKKIKNYSTLTREQALELIITDPLYEITASGDIYSLRKGRKKLKPKKSNKISSISYRQIPIPIHRIVARKFIGPIPKGYVVNHKDGNQTNNNIENLEIMSQSQNMKHSAQILQKKPKGRNDPKLNKKVLKMSQKMTYSQIARKLKIHHGVISRIIKNNKI